MSPTASKPVIVAISLDHRSSFDDMYANLLSRLLEKAAVKRAKKPASALNLLSEGPPPAAVLITDSALTKESPEVWDAVIAYVRQGGAAVLMGHFSSFTQFDKFEPFFLKAGLDWKPGDYHRTDVFLNPQAAGNAARRLPAHYSQKAVFLKNVRPTEVLYGPTEVSITQSHVFPPENVTDLTQAAVAFAQVGNGKIGYVGDVNTEAGSDEAIMAMCGLIV